MILNSQMFHQRLLKCVFGCIMNLFLNFESILLPFSPPGWLILWFKTLEESTADSMLLKACLHSSARLPISIVSMGRGRFPGQSGARPCLTKTDSYRWIKLYQKGKKIGKIDEERHTWLIRHSWREEKALLGGSCCCQSALVVWKNGDHERRHVTLDLLNRQRVEIRERPKYSCGTQKHRAGVGGGGDRRPDHSSS